MGRVHGTPESPGWFTNISFPAAAPGFPVTRRSAPVLCAGPADYGIDTHGKGAVTILHHQSFQGIIP
jgi:hypothetical protein